MYFSLFYILFFTLDILLVSNFEVLGMIPMNFLVAGTGLFSFFYLLRHNKFLKINSRFYFFSKLFLSYIILISLFNLVQGAYPVFSSFIYLSKEKWFAISSLLNKIPFVFSLVILFIAFFILPLKSSLNCWIFYSAATGLVRYGILVLVKTLPPLLYRYYGVFDLIMLFGWLMIINTSIKKEYSFGIS